MAILEVVIKSAIDLYLLQVIIIITRYRCFWYLVYPDSYKLD